MDEEQASAGSQSALTALLHPCNAAVTLPLSRSMPSSGGVADGLTRRAAIALAPGGAAGALHWAPLEPPLPCISCGIAVKHH